MSKFFTSLLYFTVFVSVCLYAQQKPTPIAYHGLSVDLLATGKITLDAKLFDAGSFDKIFPTKDLTLKIQVPAATDNAVYDATKVKSSHDFDCVGNQTVSLWVGNPTGEWSFASTYVEIQNPLNLPNIKSCNPSILDSCLNEKKVKIVFGESNTCNIKPAITYQIAPTATLMNPKTDTKQAFCVKENDYLNFKIEPITKNPLNGISTLDLVLIAKHILGTQPIASNYAQIAADVNNSGKISAADLIELRKLILGLIPNFTNNESWRFFPALPSSNGASFLSYKITGDNEIKIFPVKIGDINGNADCTTITKGRNGNTTYFDLDDVVLHKDDTYTLSLSSEQLDGFQSTLQFDDKALELIALDENSTLNGFQSILTAQLKGEKMLATFKAKKILQLSDAIRMNDVVLESEGYNNEEINRLALRFKTANNYDFLVLQNQPNPFNNTTDIQFQVANTGDYTLTVFDFTGKKIKSIQGKAEKGMNNIRLEMENTGVFAYEIRYNGQSIVKKMIVQ